MHNKIREDINIFSEKGSSKVYFLRRSGTDPFSTGINGARRSLGSLIDSSFSAESIDTHNDHDIKIFGSILASFPPRASKCVKFAKFHDFCQFSGDFLHVKVMFWSVFLSPMPQ